VAGERWGRCGRLVAPGLPSALLARRPDVMARNQISPASPADCCGRAAFFPTSASRHGGLPNSRPGCGIVRCRGGRLAAGGVPRWHQIFSMAANPGQSGVRNPRAGRGLLSGLIAPPSRLFRTSRMRWAALPIWSSRKPHCVSRWSRLEGSACASANITAGSARFPGGHRWPSGRFMPRATSFPISAARGWPRRWRLFKALGGGFASDAARAQSIGNDRLLRHLTRSRPFGAMGYKHKRECRANWDTRPRSSVVFFFFFGVLFFFCFFRAFSGFSPRPAFAVTDKSRFYTVEILPVGEPG